MTNNCNECEVPLGTSASRCACGKVSYCGTECQKADWKSHKPSCPPFKVLKQSGKGRGLVATRKINVGDIILDEKPLMVIDSPGSKVGADVFKVEFFKLDDETENTILDLFDPIEDATKLELRTNIHELETEIAKGKEENPENQTLADVTERLKSLGTNIKEPIDPGDSADKALRIFTANSLQVCEVSSIYSDTEGALYNQISLLNHSCNPNSTWSWVKDDFRRKQLRAMKSVKKGEEIVVNYVDIEQFNFGIRDYRRNVLVDKFGFICKCSECSLSNDLFTQNEEIRRKIVENLLNVKNLMDKFDKKSTIGALKIGTNTVGLVRDLGMICEVPRVLLNCYQICIAARYQKIPDVPSASIFSDQAHGYCHQFGDSFMYFYNFVCKQN